MLRMKRLSGEVLTCFHVEELNDVNVKNVKDLKQRLHQHHDLPPRFRQRILRDDDTNDPMDDAVMLDSLLQSQAVATTYSQTGEGASKKQRLLHEQSGSEACVVDLQVVLVAFCDASAHERLELAVMAQDGRADKVEALLQLPMDPDAVFTDDIDGLTPLMIASVNGRVEIAHLLLEAGADKDVVSDSDGCTALMCAARTGHAQVLQLLLDAGAQTDLCDSDTLTALMAAAARGHAPVVQLLLEAGAQKDLRDDRGSTALMRAAYNGHAAVVRLLLQAGCQPDTCDNLGKTPLMDAASHDHAEVVRLLLEARAEKDVRNLFGQTALMVADDPEVRRLLEATHNKL